MAERQFPVLNGGRIMSVPWRIVEPHRRQAERNHGGQSLEKLAQRGGLDLAELVAVLADENFDTAFVMRGEAGFRDA